LRFFLVAILVLCAFGAHNSHAISVLDVDPSCAAGSSISIRLFFLDDPSNPSPLPAEWVGYDLFREPADYCPNGNAPVRVNQDIILRPAAGVHELTYVDTPPDPAGTYRYTARFVDAARNQVQVPSCYDCRFGAADNASCPPNTVPVSVGRIVDWGWTLYLEPCAGTCFSGGILDGEPWEEELAPYAGTNTVFNIYGSIGCCSVEGPGILIHRYEIASCGPTPTARASWGRVKAIYR
jgi:hypothetical protein